VQLTTVGRRAAARGSASLALTLAGCSGGASPGATATATPPPKPDLAAHLDNMPQGIVSLKVDDKTHRITAHLDVNGLAAGTAHAVQLHRGTCLQRGGQLVTGFDDAKSDASGVVAADLRATSASATSIPSGVYVELHLVGAALLGSAADPTSLPIACSDIPAAAPTTAVRIFATPGHKPFGSATLKYDAAGRAANLTVDLQTLASGSVHAVQILGGTCAAPGPVLQAVGDVTADRNGTVHATQVFGIGTPPPASGWILMIRTGAAAAIGTPAQPTPQAQPLLCGPLSKPA
jgi:hypothetical protein